MASPAPPTIQALKQDFIAEQTRLLSQPLAPSRAWSKANSSAAAAATGTAPPLPLPQKAVDDALARFNHRLQQHSARVYSPPATRHVAEQLEQLYLAAERDGGAPRAGEDGHDDGGGDAGLTLSADFADPQTIAALPPSWPSDQDVSARPMEARRYADLSARLQDLSAARGEAEARARRLRDMRRGLVPFIGGGDGGESLQRNLVTKDGELERSDGFFGVKGTMYTMDVGRRRCDTQCLFARLGGHTMNKQGEKVTLYRHVTVCLSVCLSVLCLVSVCCHPLGSIHASLGGLLMCATCIKISPLPRSLGR
ncbi:hypothetical protein RB601_009915 [Gaeumannomyces tritici]